MKILHSIMEWILLLLSGLTFAWSISDSDIRWVYAGKPPDSPIIAEHFDKGKIFYFSWSEFFQLKNYGIKSGHIDRVEIRPLTLDIQPKIEILYVDRNQIHMWQSRKITYKCLIKWDHIVYNDTSKVLKREIPFAVTLYDNKNRTVHHSQVIMYLSSEKL